MLTSPFVRVTTGGISLRRDDLRRQFCEYFFFLVFLLIFAGTLKIVLPEGFDPDFFSRAAILGTD